MEQYSKTIFHRYEVSRSLVRLGMFKDRKEAIQFAKKEDAVVHCITFRKSSNGKVYRIGSSKIY